jgi:hypothetical protein
VKRLNLVLIELSIHGGLLTVRSEDPSVIFITMLWRKAGQKPSE